MNADLYSSVFLLLLVNYQLTEKELGTYQTVM